MMQGFSPAVKKCLAKRPPAEVILKDTGRWFGVDVLIWDQETGWVLELKQLCKKDGICFWEKEEEAEDIRLVVMGFPIERIKNGRFAGVPFLLVSKEQREEKILEAFAAGAEDYMVFPVSPRVARARILRILEQDWERAAEIEMKSLQEKVHFTPNEYKIFSLMRKHPGKVFTRNELLEEAFLEMYEGYDRNVDNYIKQIRKKLPEKEGKIETAYGVGYRFVM